MALKFLPVFFFLFASMAKGQIMVPQTTTMSTPYGNVTTTQYMHMPMYYGQRGAVSSKYNFTLVLKGDSTVQANNARIDIKEKTHHFKVKSGKQKFAIKPSDTKEVFRLTSGGKKLSGIPADSCWLFKAVTGTINGYSYLAETGYSYIIAIQDGEEAPIIPLTKKNLETMIGTLGNEKVMKHLEKKRLISALEEFNREDTN